MINLRRLLVSPDGITRLDTNTGNQVGRILIETDASGILGTWRNVSGETYVDGDGNSGANLLGVSIVRIENGEFRLDNGGSGAQDQLADNADVVLAGQNGNFDYVGTRNASTPSTETIGRIVLESAGEVDVSTAQGSGNAPTLILSDATNGLNQGIDGHGTMLLRVNETGGDGTIENNIQIDQGYTPGQLLPFIATSTSGMVQLNGSNQLELVAMTSAPTDLSTWTNQHYRYDATTAPTNSITASNIGSLGILDNVSTGTVTFNVASNLTVDNGFIALARGGQFGPTRITGGTLTSGTGTFYFHNFEDTNTNLQIGSEVTGNIDVVLTGGGLIDWGIGAVAHTYTGNTYVNGVVSLGTDIDVLAIPGDLFIGAGGALSTGDSNQIESTANVTIRNLGQLTISDGDAQTISGILRIEGEGRVTLGGTGNGLTLNNSGTPGLVFNGGSIVHTRGDFSLPLRLLTDVTVEDSTEQASITYSAASTTAFNHDIFLTDSGAANRTLDVAQSSMLAADTPEFVINQQIQDGPGGAGGLIKTGDGTLALTYTETVSSSTESNLYSGGTTVSAGTLLVNNTGGSGTGSGFVLVESGATLGGTGFIAPDGADGITAESGSILAPGASIGTLTLDLTNTTGVATFDLGAEFEFELGAPGDSDTLAFLGYTAGDLVLNNNVVNFVDAGGLEVGTYTLFSFDNAHGLSGGLVVGSGLGSLSGSFDYSDPNLIQLTLIPEPSVAALLGLGFAVLLGRRNRARA